METECARILGLPVYEETDDEVQGWVDQWTDRLRYDGGDWRLRPVQAQALEHAHHAKGLLGGIDVGGGKTLLAMCLPYALGVDPSDTVVLAPAHLIAQAERQWAEYAEHFDIEMPVYLSYACLSRPDYVTWLAAQRPRLIIADEAHKLRNPKATRTRRFLRYFAENPDTMFCALTASLTSSSLFDFSHLAALALGSYSPVPTPSQWSTLKAWAACVDDKPADPPTRSDWARTSHLRATFGDGDEASDLRAATRGAFLRRLQTAPGVVLSTGSSCDRPLAIRTWSPPVPPCVDDALDRLWRSYTLPNGVEVLDPLRAAEAARQLSQGFFYYPDWPGGVVDYEWLYARSAFEAEVAKAVSRYAAQGLDSRSLVIRAARRGQIALDSLADWDAVRHRPPPPQAVEWLTDDVLLAAMERTQAMCDTERRAGLLWVSHIAVAERMGELGARVVGAGELPPLDAKAGDWCVVRVQAHGTGTECQPYSYNLVLCPSSNGGTHHQLWGRTHRYGQTRDVVGEVAVHTDALRGALDNAVENSHYLHQMTGTKPRLLVGYDTETTND